MAKRADQNGRGAAGAGASPRVAVVVSRYNASVTSRLLEGALGSYASVCGGGPGVDVFDAPGAFEVLALAARCAETGRYQGVVALGCVIRGETRHDEFLAHAVTTGLGRLSVDAGVAVGLGVLTVNTPSQARARAGGRLGNKGAEAMEATLRTIAQTRLIRREALGSWADGLVGSATPTRDKTGGRR
jgi:6,7-dimethyl-8-ribityllumazine synthase